MDVGGAVGDGSRIERFADSVDAKLRGDEKSTTSMRAFTRSKFREVLRRSGYERRSDTNVARIETALATRGVFADPPLTTPGLGRDQQIYFTRSPQVDHPVEHRVAFRTEYDLETFLVDNFDYLVPGLRLVDRQFEVQTGRIDLLATDRDGYVVIELKKARPTKDLVFAVSRYMEDVAAWLAQRGDERPVRGLIVSERVDRRMHQMLDDLATSRGHRIDWMEYRVDLVLREVGEDERDLEVARTLHRASGGTSLRGARDSSSEISEAQP